MLLCNRKNVNLIQISILTFVLHLPVVSHAATLINGFSGGPVQGTTWVQPDWTWDTLNFTRSFDASTGSVAGLVNTGFVTVDYRNMSLSPFENYAFGAYVAGHDGSILNLSGITGFNVSLRKEANNSADSLNFYIFVANDGGYMWNISTSDLSTTEFRSIPIVLSNNSTWASGAPTQAYTIAVGASAANPANTRYNFSIDSISAVPEPSSSLLVASGLGVLGLLRRRSRQ